MVKDTSLEAYIGINEDGVAITQRGQIYNTLVMGRMTRRELSQLTGIEINAVCGRVNELLKMGLIHEFESRPCSVSGHSAHPIGVQ